MLYKARAEQGDRYSAFKKRGKIEQGDRAGQSRGTGTLLSKNVKVQSRVEQGDRYSAFKKCESTEQSTCPPAFYKGWENI